MDKISNNIQKFLGSNLDAIINNLDSMKLDQLNYTQKYNNCEDYEVYLETYKRAKILNLI